VILYALRFDFQANIKSVTLEATLSKENVIFLSFFKKILFHEKFFSKIKKLFFSSEKRYNIHTCVNLVLIYRQNGARGSELKFGGC